MDFTPKQRLLSAIKGLETDYTPFSPFLAYYFDFLPMEIQIKGELDYLINMGADPLLRGALQAYQIKNNNCDIIEKSSGNKKYTTYTTKKGDLHAEYTFVETANTWFLSKHPVSTIEDIELLKLYFEDMNIIPAIDIVNSQVKSLGEQGLQLAILGINLKSSFQSLVEHWIGTENLAYLCTDNPDEIDDLLSVMRAKNIKTVEYTAQSDAAACISWEDSSTTNISPGMYQNYIMPEITEWCNLLRQADKPYIQHACGHIKNLLIPMVNQGVSAIESISPPPTGNVTIAEAIEILPQKVSIIGGIEPIQFLNEPVERLLEYVESLIKINKGRGFILANSDSCPPGVEYEKFTAIAEFVKNYK